MNLDDNIIQNIEYEVFKRFNNTCLFRDEKILSGQDELKRILHKVYQKSDYLNKDAALESKILSEINEIYDAIALNKADSKAIAFSQKYILYVEELKTTGLCHYKNYLENVKGT